MTSREDLLAKLTNRQREVLNLLAERLSDGEIKRLLEVARERKLDMTLIRNLLNLSARDVELNDG
jgi:DNA-binding CsgD family transcriptional regulator